MSTGDYPRREHPSTYFVQDRSSQEELNRLRLQDQIVTAGMGGVLPEQTDVSSFRRVLDVGCGIGGWLIEIARTYPDISLLMGVDVSGKMLDYARMQAAEQQVGDRVEFHQMDALRMLEFPSSYFDLVNHRLGLSWLRTWDWPKLLQEYVRVTRPGGVIRITESDTLIEGITPARKRLFELTLDAFYNAGHFFVREKDGVTGQLARLLQQYGLQNVQTQTHTLEFHGGTDEGERFYEDVKLAYHGVVPFFRKWTKLPKDYEAVYEEVLREMQEPGFVSRWVMVTAWGRKRE
jgi:ubiquinone/menaquinone biosynthesis C-methylase UbiE